VLQEVFDGLIAAGTLTLAWVTYRLVKSTTGSVREAYRSRVDASAHRVVVHGLSVWDQCANRETVARAEPYFFSPGIGWDLTQSGGALIGLPASVTVSNEGAVSALMELGSPDDVEFWRVHASPLPGEHALQFTSLEQQGDGTYLLPARTEAEVGFIWWQASDRWALAAKAGGVPQTWARITVRDVAGGAIDTWELIFGAQVLWRHATKDGWIVAARDMRHMIENPPDLPVTIVGPMNRAYPSEPLPRPSGWSQIFHNRPGSGGSVTPSR
jgi:hypothetical protein